MARNRNWNVNFYCILLIYDLFLRNRQKTSSAWTQELPDSWKQSLENPKVLHTTLQPLHNQAATFAKSIKGQRFWDRSLITGVPKSVKLRAKHLPSDPDTLLNGLLPPGYLTLGLLSHLDTCKDCVIHHKLVLYCIILWYTIVEYYFVDWVCIYLVILE